MIRVELAEKIITKLGYSSSLIHRAINAKELETVSDDRILSDYEYAITRDSFHGYLYKIGIREHQVNCIMDYI